MSKAVEIVLLVASVLSLGITLLVNYFIGFGGIIFGLNFTSVADVSDIYDTDITPSGWTFSIWGIIYAWQAVLLIYLASLLFRKSSSDGDDFPSKGRSLHPAVSNTPLFYAFYLANFCANIVWIFLWCLEYVEFAMLAIALIAASLWSALALSCYGLTREAQQMANGGRSKDVWLNVVCVQNGLCVYGTWTTVATMINLNIVLVYEGGMPMADGSTVALFCLAAALGAWWVIETFVCEKACRYCFLPYVVVVYAIAGSIDRNWAGGDSSNSIVSATLLAVAGLLLIVKVARAIVNEKRDPYYYTKVGTIFGGDERDLKSQGAELNGAYSGSSTAIPSVERL